MTPGNRDRERITRKAEANGCSLDECVADALRAQSTGLASRRDEVRFELSRLGSVDCADALTNSGFQRGDAEKRPSVELARSNDRPLKPDSETNGETQKCWILSQLQIFRRREALIDCSGELRNGKLAPRRGRISNFGTLGLPHGILEPRPSGSTQQ